MDHKTVEKTILLVWLYFTIRILFVTYWDALFLPPILIVLDNLFKNSKSDSQTQTEVPFQATQNDSEKNKRVNKEDDQNLTIKENNSEKITSPAIEKFTASLKVNSIKDSEKSNTETDIHLDQDVAKIQELSSCFTKLLDLQNSLKSVSRNSLAPPNCSVNGKFTQVTYSNNRKNSNQLKIK
ncbi:hypothetical protein TNCT_207471 [Trichonephila clavata]|uniref:Uncharacterized protein n=1 Tax=Trichonephila clavata TaxID=2740835 RepID=A0A8X6F6V0_TRICU|nr:hypothetical protein TNCT_207471 [Trichonephila clavata]